MAGEYVVWKSEFITTAEEARQYYDNKLAGCRRSRRNAEIWTEVGVDA